MKTIIFPGFFVVSALILTACGENFSAANVSLGGSGSGTQKPLPGGGGNGGISNPSTGDKDERYEYFVTAPPESQSNCNGIQRNLRLIDGETGQPLTLNAVHALAKSPLQVEITNTTADYIYQLVPSCRPVEFQVGDTVIFHGQSFRCADGQDELQVLRPYETRHYELDLNFAETELPFTVNYKAFYHTTPPTPETVWEKCDAAQLGIPIHKRRIHSNPEPVDPSGPLPEIPKGEKPE